jgi:hypothetical protein
MFSFVLGGVAWADCPCSITLKNGFPDVPLTIIKIKTANEGVGAAVYKEQWTGNVKIEAKKEHKFTFTVDSACGREHYFKFFKADGKQCLPGSGKVLCSKTVTCEQGDWQSGAGEVRQSLAAPASASE